MFIDPTCACGVGTPAFVFFGAVSPYLFSISPSIPKTTWSEWIPGAQGRKLQDAAAGDAGGSTAGTAVVWLGDLTLYPCCGNTHISRGGLCLSVKCACFYISIQHSARLTVMRPLRRWMCMQGRKLQDTAAGDAGGSTAGSASVCLVSLLEYIFL